jgi:hypothetical protein
LNVAVTVVAVFTVTAQVAVPPLHAPLQPAKTEPDAAVAVSFARVPGATASVQSLPHAIPARKLFTVPEPVPFFVIDSVMAVPAVAEPLTPREMVSPPAVKFTLLAKLPALVGWNRRVTVRLAPGDSEKEPPDAMLNGAPTFAPPEMLAVLVFCTVNVRSTMPPVVTFPKFVATVGVTLKTGWATPLTGGEHALSLPEVSMAVTRTEYVAPAFRPATRWLTVCPAAGCAVGDGTVRNDAPGQAGCVVPK